jgi:hypothetical protein
MEAILKKLMDIEFRTATKKNYKLDLWLTFIGATIFAVMSFTANSFGWAGLLLAVLFFWHRYVVLNIVRNRSSGG